MPPPLDPLQVGILVRRLEGFQFRRPQSGLRIGGVQYNSIIRRLFQDLRRDVGSSPGSTLRLLAASFSAHAVAPDPAGSRSWLQAATSAWR